ncbi:LytTR family DNA-binding domain-containing protein [Coralliovum pocilloporae]|uniref:LytTR family DNA-binding domain-containing protein n=1 Tax=Coralliovum pocilloporae TaxID=3066369 RepID=UPI003306DAF6
MKFIRLPLTLRERLIESQWFWSFCILMGAVTFASVIGPFGTYIRLDWPLRIAYWVVLLGPVWLFGHWMFRSDWIAGRCAALPVPRSLLLALLVSVPIAVWVSLVNRLFFPEANELPGLVYLVAVGFGIALLWNFITDAFLGQMLPSGGEIREGDSGPEDDPATLDDAEPVFFRRLKTIRFEQLTHLTMRDHYVEACAADGSELVLMRFSDAISELENLQGARVHRSHWVVRAAVRSVLRENGRYSLELLSGHVVPISRSYVKELKAEGWLD